MAIKGSGQCVIVTGAAQGIGRRLVHELVGQGIGVVIADMNEDKGRIVASEPSEGAGERLFVRCDVTRADDCRRVVAEATAAFGGVSGLVNNASIFSTIEMRPFWEIPEAEWDQVIDVNLKGVWQMSKAALPELKKSRGAAIVNIASAVVHMGRANYAHYVSSKAGVIGLSRAMAREVGGFGIRVNIVTPGPIFTEVPRPSVTAGQKQGLLDAQALNREGVPQDITSVIQFLLSDASGFMTGQIVNVDGGFTMY